MTSTMDGHQQHGPGCGCHVGIGTETDIVDVIQDLETARRLVIDRLNPKGDPLESEVFALAALLVMLAENMLLLGQNNINPFAMIPSGDTHFERLKADFYAHVNLIHTALSSDFSRRRQSSDNPTANGTRPGCTLNQPATLTCPYCSAAIPAAIAARVSTDPAENPTGNGNKSIKVRVNLQGQPTSGSLVCPSCQRPTKMKLQVASEADGQTSNLLNVRVALETELASVGETRKMISDATHLLNVAADNIIGIAQAQSQPTLDNQTLVLVVKSIVVAFSILLAVRDNAFRQASWMKPGQNGISVFSEVGGFIREHIGLVQVMPSSAQ